MNCEDAKPQLVELLYGEVGAEHRARLQEHLAGCDYCRQELESLERSRQFLNLLPARETAVDLNNLYRRAAARTEQSRRVWRRGALAACAAAALVAGVALAGLNVELSAGTLVLSWRAQPATAQPPAPAPEVPLPTLTRYDRRLGELEELVQLLATEVDAGERRHQRTFAALARELVSLERQARAGLDLLQRDVRDLYLAQYPTNLTEAGGPQ